MEKLVDKQSYTFDYKSRYTGIPYYFNTSTNRETPGICKQINFNTAYVLHKIKPTDTLDSLSLEYYSNPTYWWAIAFFNKINDPFIDLALKYKSLKIPALSSIIFED
jgi:nucleoid-associated protein YgaU